MTRLNRRHFCASLALAIEEASARAADPWPTKLVTIVVAQGPGSGSDVIARLIAGYMAPLLGQNVIVENRAGGAGITAHQSVGRAPPDGYTLLLTSTAPLFVYPVINPNARYSINDFTPIAGVVRATYTVLVANTAGAPRTLPELIERLRAKSYSYASSGVGSLTHLASELLLRKAGVQAVHVPYRGSGAALTDVIGGQVLFASDSLAAAMPLIRGGRLRALAVTDDRRVASIPDVPTVGELGFGGTETVTYAGLFGPKGMAPDVVDKLSGTVRRVLDTPDVEARLAALESEPLKVSAAQFDAILRREQGVWQPLAKSLNIRVE